MKHLSSCRTSKEELARHIAAEQGIRSGPVCALTCVEPYQSFRLDKNQKTGWLEPVLKLRPCVALYLYSIPPELGWKNARIQTGFPFANHICWNGREWRGKWTGSNSATGGTITVFPGWKITNVRNNGWRSSGRETGRRGWMRLRSN